MKTQVQRHTKAMIFNSLSFVTLLPAFLLLVLALAFIGSTVTVNQYFRNEMTKVMDNNLNFVSQNLDFLFQDVLSTASGFSVNSEVKSLSSSESTSSSRIIDARRLQTSLSNLTASKDMMEHIYLYFPNQEYVVGDVGAYTNPQELFSTIVPREEFSLADELKTLEFASFLPEKTIQDASGRQFRAIPFLYPVSNSCKLVILLDSQYLDQLMFSTEYDMFHISLRNSQNQVVKDNGVGQNEKAFIKAARESRLTSLTYDISIPQSVVDARFSGINRFAVPLIILFVVSSGVTFYLLRRKVYLPIQNMVNNLEAMLPSSEKEPVRTRGELTRLQQNIEEMFSENCAFKLRESQSNEMQNELRLQRVLFDLANAEDFEQLDRECPVLEAYVVLDIMLEPAQSEQEELMPLREQLIEGIGQVAEVEHLYSGSDVLFPYLVQVRSQQEYTALLELLHEMDQKARQAQVFMLFAVSCVHHGAGEVKLAAEEGASLLEERSAAWDERILSALHREEFCPSDAAAESNPLTFEKEKALVNCLHGGLADSVEELLEELLESMRQMPYRRYCEQCDYLMKLLLMAISTTNIQADFGKQLSAEYYGGLRGSCNPQRLQAFVKNGFIQAATLAGNSSRKDTKEKILRYIEDHLCSAVTLQAVADACGISSQYLSAYFKKEMGINFKTYVDTQKMEEAKRRLMQTGGSIQEIAQSLGFSESKNFIRVFKKYESMTPGEYRERMGYRREDHTGSAEL